MRSRVILILLTTLGAVISWWPVCIQPGLDLSFWVPLVCVALCTGLSTTLAPKSWPLFLLASGLSTFVGLSACIVIWSPSGPAVGADIFYIGAVSAVAVMLVTLASGVIMRRRAISNAVLRHAIWAVILACVAFGPVTLALTPAGVRHRIARNDRVAAERFASLKKAVESTRAEARGYSQICDGTALRRHYAGPRFSDTDWRRITGNYVSQDGYVFMVHCREKGGYTIDAWPTRERGDGTRRFCTDESDRVGCRVKFDGVRYKCLPCPK